MPWWKVHADLSPSAKTLPVLAELVLRKLNLCPGGIAQLTQTKTRVPHRRTQEGFGSGIASVHAGLLIPMRLAPSAVLSEQVRVVTCAAGTAAKQVCVLNHSEMYSTSRAIVQVSHCILLPITAAHAMCPSARSSLRPTASVRFSFQCRNGESLLHGFFRSERSYHPFLHVFKKVLVQWFLDLAMCCGCAVGSSFVAAAPFAIHERHAGCMAGPAGLLATSRAVVLVAGWIRPQIASAYAMHPSAASSRRPGAAPACLACVSLQSRYGESSWQGYLRRVPSQHLVVSRQGNKHSLLDLAVAITMPCTCAVKFSLLFAWCGAKHLRDASCMFGPLTTSRAIVPVSGCICPPVSSANAIRASAASSHRSSTAPICFSPQCRDGESLLHGFFRSERSRHPFLHVFKKVQLFLDLAMCCGCAVGSSFVAAAPFAIHERHAGCMAGPAGLLTTSRAVVPVAGWIRLQIASAYAMHPLSSFFTSTRCSTGMLSVRFLAEQIRREFVARIPQTGAVAASSGF